MASSDQSADQTELVAAARAAANWAHARRATWTHTPLPKLAPSPAPPPPPVQAVAAVPPAVAVKVPQRAAAPSAWMRLAAFRRPIIRLVVYWLPRVVATAALAAVVVAGGLYSWDRIGALKARLAIAKPVKPPPPAPAPAPKPTGDLAISSTPQGAQVIVDGKPRGVTPLTLSDVAPGRHTVVLKSETGTIQRTVTVVAGKTAEVEESVFSGWLAVFAPFDLVIIEGNRSLRLDDRNQVMLPSGHHELKLLNRTLGYETVRQVDVKPGETTRMTITPPPSSVTLTATEPTEVWLDGTRLGVTPLSTLAVSLGTHEFVARRATGAEKRFTVTVTVNPLTLNVDF